MLCLRGIFAYRFCSLGAASAAAEERCRFRAAENLVVSQTKPLLMTLHSHWCLRQGRRAQNLQHTAPSVGHPKRGTSTEGHEKNSQI